MNTEDVKRNTIRDFFHNGSIYNVPIYQRKYVWDEDTIEQLFDDFKILLMEEDKEKTLYFGNVLIKKEDWSLVDGQQRITTFLIFFKSLLDDYRSRNKNGNYNDAVTDKLERLIYAEENDSLKKRVKIQDKLNIEKFDNLFDEYKFIKLNNFNSNSWKNKSIYHKNYSKFRELLDDFFRNLNGIFDTNDFIEIFKRIWVIKINLNHTDDELKIFETLNSKGTFLEAFDLIKNYYFLKLLNFDKNKTEKIKLKIGNFFEKEIYEIINKNWGKLKEREIKKIIKEYIIFKSIKHSNIENDVLATLSLPEEKSAQDLYKKFKIVTEAEFNNLKSENDILNSIEDLRGFSIMKKKIKDCQNDEKHNWESYRLSLMIFNDVFSGSQFFPIVAQLLNYEMNEQKINIEEFDINNVSYDFKKSILFLENFVVRRNTVGKGTRLLTRTINKINVNKYEDLKREFKELEPNDFEFKQGLEKENFLAGHSINIVKSMLWRLELSEYKTKNNETINEIKDKNKITVEHIMPQNLNAKWKLDLGFSWEAKHNKYVNSIDNLTITSNNSKLGNKDFETIKKEYFKEGIILMNKKIADSSRWTEKEIQARADELIDRSLEIWKI